MVWVEFDCQSNQHLSIFRDGNNRIINTKKLSIKICVVLKFLSCSGSTPFARITLDYVICIHSHYWVEGNQPI